MTEFFKVIGALMLFAFLVAFFGAAAFTMWILFGVNAGG